MLTSIPRSVLAIAILSTLGALTRPDQAGPPPSPPSLGAAAFPTPHFDVISIHPVDMTKDTSAWGLVFRDGDFTGYQVTASMLLWAATGLSDVHRIKGLPEWASHTKYTVHARVLDDGAKPLGLTKKMQQDLLMSLLVSRFNYSGHFHDEECPALALTVAKSDKIHLARHSADSGSASELCENGTEKISPATSKPMDAAWLLSLRS